MYFINDKNAAIKEVQKYLHTVSQIHDDIPHVTTDGFYNEETAGAVKEFQRIMELPISGTVDKETFDLLYIEYKNVLYEAEYEKGIFDKSAFPLKLGSNGNDVLYLNTLIRELAVYYKDLELPFGDFYSAKTEASVKMLQQYFLMESDGTVSIEMINRLKKELTARSNFSTG